MFGFFKKRKPPPVDIRGRLFCDVAWSDVQPQDGASAEAEPWSSFAAARRALDARDSAAAIAALRRLTEAAEQQPRTYLQAWHFLRELGVQPDADQAKRVRGVILEVQLDEGLDTLAAYADRTARYINYSGGVIVWEAQEPNAMAPLIDTLLRAGQRAANVIGPWDKARRGAPPSGHIRLNMLTAAGLHFGEGPFERFNREPLGGPVVAAGGMLMQALIAKTAPPEAAPPEAATPETAPPQAPPEPER